MSLVHHARRVLHRHCQSCQIGFFQQVVTDQIGVRHGRHILLLPQCGSVYGLQIVVLRYIVGKDPHIMGLPESYGGAVDIIRQSLVPIPDAYGFLLVQKRQRVLLRVLAVPVYEAARVKPGGQCPQHQHCNNSIGNMHNFLIPLYNYPIILSCRLPPPCRSQARAQSG